MLNLQTLVLSKKYTDDTAVGFGGLKGANCTIDNIEKKDGQNIVTFKWTGTDGSHQFATMTVDDGTPIYVWTAGHKYEFGDLAIYASCLYRCTEENADSTFDDAKWAEIGSPDGNYDIISTETELPNRFTAADKKMYYIIDKGYFYLWNGKEWLPQIETNDIDFTTFL